MSKASRFAYYIISFLFFVLTDFYFCGLILTSGYKMPENPVFSLTFIQNDGAAFNILQNSRMFLILFSLAAIGCICFYIIKNISKFSIFTLFCTSMLCAGIFCNTYERIVYGYVRDFISLNFVDFPVFNISDIFICLSVFAIVIIIIKSSYFKKS